MLGTGCSQTHAAVERCTLGRHHAHQRLLGGRTLAHTRGAPSRRAGPGGEIEGTACCMAAWEIDMTHCENSGKQDPQNLAEVLLMVLPRRDGVMGLTLDPQLIRDLTVLIAFGVALLAHAGCSRQARQRWRVAAGTENSMCLAGLRAQGWRDGPYVLRSQGRRDGPDAGPAAHPRPDRAHQTGVSATGI